MSKNKIQFCEHCEPMTNDERILRELVAFNCSGFNLYRDDGELSDCSEVPHIDYMRDSPKEIKEKLRVRRVNEFMSECREDR